MEPVDVVDMDDNVIRTIDRKEQGEEDILRVAEVVMFNSKGDMLLQLRAKCKERYPSHWDLAGGGHVDSGESYDVAAKRELFEELGIKAELEFLGKHYLELPDSRKHMISLYKGVYDGPFELDEAEVEKVQFFSIEGIRNMIGKGVKMHPHCLFALRKYFLSKLL